MELKKEKRNVKKGSQRKNKREEELLSGEELYPAAV